MKGWKYLPFFHFRETITAHIFIYFLLAHTKKIWWEKCGFAEHNLRLKVEGLSPKDLAVDLLKTGSSKSEKRELKGIESKTDNVLNNKNCWASDLICMWPVCSVFQRRTSVALTPGGTHVSYYLHPFSRGTCDVPTICSSVCLSRGNH